MRESAMTALANDTWIWQGQGAYACTSNSTVTNRPLLYSSDLCSKYYLNVFWSVVS